MYQIKSEFWIPQPIEKVWELYRFPKTLEKISPPYMGLRVLGEPETQVGTLVEVEMRPYSLPYALQWRTRVTQMQDAGEKRFFVDEMEGGFFKAWKHTHRLEKGDETLHGSASGQDAKVHTPGTWVLDEVDYDLPLGPLNETANALLVRRTLAAMFSYRKRALQNLAIL
jgi:ligand-binding SRPBCC domain-containing protein